nr:MAG TPA: Replication initiation and membrane attachment [Caudoviricetes sp.]
MADKKYYWLKLPADFFSKPSLMLLTSKGADHINVYMRLLTMAINTDCRLMYTEDTPYTVEMLSMMLGYQKDTMQEIIDNLIQFKLLEVLEDGSYYLVELPEMIGSESTSAERQRKSRQERDKGVTGDSGERDSGVTSCDMSVTSCDKTVTSCDISAQCHIENRDIEIENRDLKENIYSRAGSTVCVESDTESVQDETKGEPRAEQAKKPKKAKETKADTDATEVIDYLNTKTGSSYRATTEANIKPIRARLNDGFTVEDCKKVIDTKSGQWLNNPDMVKYLRPATLFSPSKFEGYLNECRGKPSIRGDSPPISKQEAFNRSISEAIQRRMLEPVENPVTDEMLDALGIK